jgi:superfamily II DNA or RNA helicase
MNEKRSEIQSLALRSALAHHRSTSAVSMRVGKTYIGLQYLDEKCKGTTGKLLVVAPFTAIFQSWVDDALKFGMTHLLQRIRFSTYLSLNKQDTDYDAIILDEVHSLKSGHSEYLARYEGPVLGLTGTRPRRRLSEKYQMLERYCPVAFEYTTNEAVNDGILNNYHIFVHVMDLSREPVVKVRRKNGGIFYQSEQARYNYYCHPFEQARQEREKGYETLRELYQAPAGTIGEEAQKARMIERLRAQLKEVSEKERTAAMFLGRALMGMPTKERYTARLLKTIHEKCIVFANTKEQADKLCAYSYHSGNKSSRANLDKFREDEIPFLSCISQLSEGVTIPGLKECIILHAYGSEKKGPQRLVPVAAAA